MKAPLPEVAAPAVAALADPAVVRAAVRALIALQVVALPHKNR